MDWKPLDPRARLLFYIQAFARLLFFWAPVTIGAVVAMSFVVGIVQASLAGVALFFLLFMAALWFPTLAFARWAWVIRDSDLLIARGVWVRSITAIPVSRIQHVDTQQGPVEQWMGLARVQIHTASGVGGDGVIPGLRKAEAEALRDTLIQVSGDGGV